MEQSGHIFGFSSVLFFENLTKKMAKCNSPEWVLYRIFLSFIKLWKNTGLKIFDSEMPHLIFINVAYKNKQFCTNFRRKIIFSTHELHIVLQRENLEIEQHSSFFNYWTRTFIRELSPLAGQRTISTIIEKLKCSEFLSS